MSTPALQPAEQDDSKVTKSVTLFELEKAQETLSGACHPDEAQRVVHEFRENQENGASKDFDDQVATLQRRLKNGSKLRFKKKRKK